MSKEEKKKKNKGGENLAEGTLISHLLELRDRLVKAVAGVFLLLVPAIYFKDALFSGLVRPLLANMQVGDQLIATSPMAGFMMPIKLGFFMALFAAMPWVLYQIWAFVAPGLYRKEKRFAVPLLLSSIVLFYVGMAFAYFVVFDMAFHFLMGATPEDVANMQDINLVLNFVLATFLAFGIAFEVPVVVMLLVLTGLVTTDKIAASRGYVIIGVFVAAAVLTPPDPVSQILMAVPMWLLFEAGLLMARMLLRPAKTKEADSDGPA
ncbi:MAG TPA: twin-arginine translocase subunit TatC [Steroidobacteraceae bacterium]|nr:twin-arginine translocase subunit TatC [Steroidobacteraceae bacterium]